MKYPHFSVTIIGDAMKNIEIASIEGEIQKLEQLLAIKRKQLFALKTVPTKTHGKLFCDYCGKPHNRKRFCSNSCKDHWHNQHNPRGYGIIDALKKKYGVDNEYYCEINEEYVTITQKIIDEESAMDDATAGWDGHKDMGF